MAANTSANPSIKKFTYLESPIFYSENEIP